MKVTEKIDKSSKKKIITFSKNLKMYQESKWLTLWADESIIKLNSIEEKNEFLEFLFQ